MATGGLYGNSATGAVIAGTGSETIGLYGNSVNFSGTYFEWFIFYISETAPPTPTGGVWDFVINAGVPPSGWLASPPPTPTNTVWVSIGLVNSRSTAAIEWTAPGKFSYASGLPILSGTAVPSGIGQSDQLYIQTSTTPYSIWFNAATVWTKLTGSSLYVDLTSSQTIGGTKTFTSTVQASISGNAATATNVPYSGLTGTVPTWNQNTTGTAANVTGTVAVANGGTGATTAAGARTNLGLGSAAVLTAGAANGVATLDSGGTVPLSQIPASLQGGVSYQGTWNASTNSPTLTSGVGSKGYYYVVSTAGSTNLDGVTDWNIGDWAIFNGTAWQKIDNTDAVTSVNGLTGTVVITASSLGALTNLTSTDGSVTITSPTATTRDLSVGFAASTNNVICQVRNTTGATLTKGTAVYISGATGQIPTVSKALATSDATSAQTLGLITANLANNTNGYVTIIGLIDDVDTSAFTDGQQLYLSSTTAGALTGVKQYAPNHLVYVAVVEYANPVHGKLFVKVQNGYELDEIHNVAAQNPSNGNTIIWNASTNLWEAAGITAGTGISVANGAGSITVTNTAPDQTVALTGAGTTVVTGTYPNFTITSNDAYTGTVTSVSGTGTVNGLTLTGTVTSSGSLTLGGTLSNVNLASQVTGTLPITNGGTGATTVSGAQANLQVDPAGTAIAMAIALG